VLDVFRFAWFAVRTAFGIIALVLVMRGALWTLVKLHSAAMAHAKPAAATYRVPARSTSITMSQEAKFEAHMRAQTSRPVLKPAYPCQFACTTKD
jgi:hypothetical protein